MPNLQTVRNWLRKDQPLPNSDAIGLMALNYAFLCGLVEATIRKQYHNWQVTVEIKIEEIAERS